MLFRSGLVVTVGAVGAEPVGTVERVDLGEGEVGHLAGAVGVAVDTVVVLHEQHVVLGEQHVEVEHVDPCLHTLLVREQRAGGEVVFTARVSKHDGPAHVQQLVDGGRIGGQRGARCRAGGAGSSAPHGPGARGQRPAGHAVRQLDGGDRWKGNPLTERHWHYGYDPEPDNDEGDWYNMKFLQQDLKKVEPDKGRFVFVNTAGDQLVLTREPETKYNYYAF